MIQLDAYNFVIEFGQLQQARSQEQITANMHSKQNYCYVNYNIYQPINFAICSYTG